MDKTVAMNNERYLMVDKTAKHLVSKFQNGGSVINKVGTSNTDIVARHYGVPYYVTGAPEPSHKTAKDVTIEMRDPDFTLTAMGVRTADEGVKGYYPSFDVTSSDFVSGVVTPEGIFKPGELEKYFKIAGFEFRVVV